MDQGPLRPDTTDWIGQRLVRVEDAALVRGAGRFVDDLRPPGCLFLAFVRSERAHGRLDSVAVAAAAAAPGVHAVLTGADLDGLSCPHVNPLLPDMCLPARPLLARGHVRAVGEPVVAVIADSPARARDAAELVEVTVDGTAADDMPAVYRRSWAREDIAGAFAAADHVVNVRIAHARLAPMAMEPRGALALWDAAAGTLTAWLPIQAPHRARTELAALLGLTPERVRVIAPDVGGAFGGKASLHPEDVVVAVAARRLGRPVKWIAGRSEDFLSATQGRGAVTEGELALAADGSFLGLRARGAFPLGHWLPYSSAAPGRNWARILPGPYRIGPVEIEVSGTPSATAAVNIYRGAGRPEAAMLLERLVDAAARRLGCDPAALRRHNLLPADALPRATPAGGTIDSGDFPGLLDAACARADYAALLARRDARRAAGDLSGVGIACYVEPCGEGWESARVHLDPDGTIVAATGSSAQGQGRETAFAQIAAAALCLSPEQIVVRHGDTAATPAGIGALASRSTAIGGSALHLACEAFRGEARAAAARLLQAAPAETVLVDGGFRTLAANAPELSWRALAEALLAERPEAQPGSPALAASATFEATETWASGCCIAALDIDPETGAPQVHRIAWTDDAGTVVNPLLAEGQLVGGAAQGLGEALMERMVYDGTGQLVTGSLMDYAVPRATDMPPIALHSRATRAPGNPLGAKGVGEAGCIGVPAALVNAALDALAPAGVTTLDMPLTADKIFDALRRARHSDPRNRP